MKSKRAIRHLRENKTGATILLCYAEQAVILAEQDAEERAMKAFKEVKERIKAAVRLTFNGYVDSQLLERRMLIFNDLLNEINNEGQRDE